MNYWVGSNSNSINYSKTFQNITAQTNKTSHTYWTMIGTGRGTTRSFFFLRASLASHRAFMIFFLSTARAWVSSTTPGLSSRHSRSRHENTREFMMVDEYIRARGWSYWKKVDCRKSAFHIQVNLMTYSKNVLKLDWGKLLKKIKLRKSLWSTCLKSASVLIIDWSEKLLYDISTSNTTVLSIVTLFCWKTRKLKFCLLTFGIYYLKKYVNRES